MPSRLLREGIDTARRYLTLDREIREIGAIPKEEASSFSLNVSVAAEQLHNSVAAADPTPAGRLAAAREWYVNAREAELYYKARADRGLNRELVSLAMSLARNRAEGALLQALAAAPPEVRDRLDPFAAAPAGYAGRVTGDWPTIKPAAGLKPLTALRVYRGGNTIGAVVVTSVLIARPNDTATVVPLPNPDGTLPELKAGDEVRP